MTKLLGQDQALRQLKTTLRSGRMHHAWIFHGPLGVGKFTAAVELARLLLAPSLSNGEIESFEVDSASDVDRLVRSGMHPDLHVISRNTAEFSDDAGIRNQKRSNIPVAVLRQFVIGGMVGEKFHEGPANTAPTMGRAKVFIIDEADYLDDAGQNAMLKTLEEPPPRVYFVLIATQPEWLLPTVRSRCRRVAFRPLSDGDMQAWLGRDHADCDADVRAWALRFSDGSPGVAQTGIQYDFFSFARNAAPMLRQLDEGAMPAELAEAINRFTGDYADAVVKANPKASKDGANKDAVAWVLRILAMHLRDALHRAGDSSKDSELAAARIQLLQDAERAVNANVNQKLALYNLLAQWQTARQRLVISTSAD